MLAQTYGMMPSAKIDRFASAPPENRLNKPEQAALPCATTCLHDVAVDARDRDERRRCGRPRASPSVKTTRRRSSGTLLMFAKPARTLMRRCLVSARPRRRPAATATRTALPPAFSIFSCALLRERVRGDGERLRELAVAEDLDAVDAALDEAALAQRASRRPFAPASKRSSSPTLTSATLVGNGLVEAALREATLRAASGRLRSRSLPTLPLAGLLALLATTGGLAEAGADAATDARACRASRRSGVRELAQSISHDS